jgi:hypothetical protein
MFEPIMKMLTLKLSNFIKIKPQGGCESKSLFTYDSIWSEWFILTETCLFSKVAACWQWGWITNLRQNNTLWQLESEQSIYSVWSLPFFFSELILLQGYLYIFHLPCWELFLETMHMFIVKGSPGAVVKLLTYDHEVMSSSPGNNLLKKCKEKLRT